MTKAMQFIGIADRFDFGAELNAWETLAGEQAEEVGFPCQRSPTLFFATFFATFLATFFKDELVKARFV